MPRPYDQWRDHMTAGIRSRFDSALTQLTEMLLDLGSRARQEVARGVQAYVTNDTELASEVIDADAAINLLQYGIEQLCYELLAMEQPVARDLRAIVSGLIMANEFERMADHGKKLARICLRTADDPRPLPADDIVRMSEAALGMFDRVLAALANRDVIAARAVCREDDLVDALYKLLFNTKLSAMLDDPRNISAGTYHIQVGHELERVGDRVTNVAERLVYAVTAELTDLNA